jgi:hypothetical protein
MRAPCMYHGEGYPRKPAMFALQPMSVRRCGGRARPCCRGAWGYMLTARQHQRLAAVDSRFAQGLHTPLLLLSNLLSSLHMESRIDDWSRRWDRNGRTERHIVWCCRACPICHGLTMSLLDPPPKPTMEGRKNGRRGPGRSPARRVPGRVDGSWNHTLSELSLSLFFCVHAAKSVFLPFSTSTSHARTSSCRMAPVSSLSSPSPQLGSAAGPLCSPHSSTIISPRRLPASPDDDSPLCSSLGSISTLVASLAPYTGPPLDLAVPLLVILHSLV